MARVPNQLWIPLLDDHQREVVTLKYQLSPSALLKAWLPLFINDFGSGSRLRNDREFYGPALTRQVEITEELNGILLELDRGRLPFFSLMRAESFTPAQMLKVHQTKEQITSLVTSGGFAAPRRFINQLERVNQLLHALEALNDPNCCLIHAYPERASQSRLKPSALEAFDRDVCFGDLLADYNTNGIDPVAAFCERVEHAPVPQTLLSSGVVLWLSGDRLIEQNEFNAYLKKWFPQYATRDIRKKMAIGYGKLGTLLSPDRQRREQTLDGLQRVRAVGKPKLVLARG